MQKIFSFFLSLTLSAALVLPDVALAVAIVNDPGAEETTGSVSNGDGIVTSGTTAGSSGGSTTGGSSGGSSGGSPQVQCTPLGGVVPQNTQGAACCAGLIIDADRKCVKDPSASDPGLVVCDPNQPNTCTENRSCLPQTAESFFKYNAGTPQDAAKLSADQASVDTDSDPNDPQDANDVGRPLIDGKACTKNSDCVSYNCVANQGTTDYFCRAKYICRYGEEDETVGAGVVCEDGFQNVGGKCQAQGAQNWSPYANILDPNSIEFKDLNRCSLEMDTTSSSTGRVALTTFRSIEWLMANFNASDDCMKINQFMKNKVAADFVEKKKTILKNFNIVMAQIENDQLNLVAATEEKTRTLTMEGENVSSYVLATRKQSGYDMLRLMMRKNAVYRSYEYAMADLATQTATKLAGLGLDMKSWTSHHSKSWVLDGVFYKSKHNRCRGGGFLNLGRRKIYKRWNKKILTIDNPVNETEVKRAEVMGTLKLISQAKEPDIIHKLFKKNIFWGLKGMYLMDPLIDLNKPGLSVNFHNVQLPFGMSYGVYGDPTSTGVLHMGNFKDLRTAIRADFIDHNKKLKSDLSNDVPPLPAETRAFITEQLQKLQIKFATGFIYEPELVDINLRGCLEPQAGGAQGATALNCTEFQKYLDNVTDHTLAAFIAWSTHGRDNYKFYFNDSGTWRHKLVQHWEGQLTNAAAYYKKKIDLRDQQDACIQQQLGQIEQNFLDGAGAAGIADGGKNYYQEGDYIDPTTGKPKYERSQITTGKPITYAWDLSLKSFSLKTAGINKDAVKVTGGPSKANMATLSANLATRIKKMQDHNDALAKKGVNIADKKAEYQETLNSLSAASGGGAGANGAGAGSMNSSAFGAFAANVKPNLDKPKDDKTGKGLGEGVGGDGRAASTLGVPTGANGLGANPYSGAFGAMGTDPAAAGAAAGPYQDPTGMTDEEKDILMKNLERNKGKYAPKEDDDLFTIISKKYTNSLHLILTKKKKVEE